MGGPRCGIQLLPLLAQRMSSLPRSCQWVYARGKKKDAKIGSLLQFFRRGPFALFRASATWNGLIDAYGAALAANVALATLSSVKAPIAVSTQPKLQLNCPSTTFGEPTGPMALFRS